MYQVQQANFSVPWKKSLKFRLTKVLVFFAIFIGIIIAFFLAFLYQNRIDNEFKNRAVSTARTTALFLDAKVIDHYLITLEKDNEYERILNNLRIKMKETGVSYIVVSRITEDCQIFVFDTDESEEGHVELGETFIFNEEHSNIRSVLQRISNGLRVEPYIHNSKWGRLFTAIEYIYREDGTVAGNIAVSIYMDNILRERRNGFFILGITIFLGFCTSLFLNLHVIQKFVISPIRKISKGIYAFPSNTDQHKLLPRQAVMRYEDELAVFESVLIDMEKRLFKSMESERTALIVKNIFLSNMSHELRTPLNSTINMIRDAMTAKDQSVRAGALHQAYASSYDLLSVVNTILEISNIENGNLIISHSPFFIGKVAVEINSIMSILCKDKGIIWEPQINISGQLSLDGDRIKLLQVLVILLKNAVLYANEVNGKVSFAIDLLEETEKTAKIRFEVSDNGIGMTENRLKVLSQIFSLENNNIHYDSGEIMLSACGSIIKAMGSQIIVANKNGTAYNSRINKSTGSCFSFSLSFPKAEMPPVPEEIKIDKINFTEKRVLIVDDIKVNRNVLKNSLLSTGISTIEAASGKEAVDIFQAESEDIDLILMDVMMPKMNGYEAARAIRASGLPKAQSVPIIAVTALSYNDDINASINAGMNAHIAKPVEPDLLLLTLVKFLEK